MKVLTTVALAITASAASLAAAPQNPPVIVAAPPALLTVAIFLAACACVFFCFQVFTVVRGGQLSKSWLLFTGGFTLLAVSQFILLLGGFGVITLNTYLVPAILATMSGVFVFGLFEVKRVLG